MKISVCNRNPWTKIKNDAIFISIIYVLTIVILVCWYKYRIDSDLLFVIFIFLMACQPASIKAIIVNIRNIGVYIERTLEDKRTLAGEKLTGKIIRIVTEQGRDLADNVKHRILVGLEDGTILQSERYSRNMVDAYEAVDGTEYSAVGYPDIDVYRIFINDKSAPVGKEVKVYRLGNTYVINVGGILLDANRL